MRATDVFTPIAFTAEERTRRDVRSLAVLGLLRRGVSREQAEAELVGIASRLALQHPETSASRGFRAQPLREALVGDVEPSFYVLLTLRGGDGAVGRVRQRGEPAAGARIGQASRGRDPLRDGCLPRPRRAPAPDRERDRKSTRLNSSHSQISYAVFCLKKKKKII